MDKKIHRSSWKEFRKVGNRPERLQYQERFSFVCLCRCREFCQEEITKTYEDSYEISDRVNVDETAPKLCVAKSPTSTSSTILHTITKEEDKENVFIKSKASETINTYEKSPNYVEDSSCGSSCQSSGLNIENSVEITLFEKERHQRYCSSEANTADFDESCTDLLNSFSLDENEKKALGFARARTSSKRFVNDSMGSRLERKQEKSKRTEEMVAQVENSEKMPTQQTETRPDESLVKKCKEQSQGDLKVLSDVIQKSEAIVQFPDYNIPRTSKVTVHKICTPLTKSISQNCKKKEVQQEGSKLTSFKASKQNTFSPHSAVTTHKNNQIAVRKPTDMSFGSVEGDLSPLCPPEFKVCNLRQLHDQIVSGKIRIFSDAKKPPNIDAKARSSLFTARGKNEKESRKQSTQNFEDDPDRIVRGTTLMEESEKKCKKNKYRYSEADDVMLDNTSFLTRAKLSDETSSRNSSKRDVTQTNDDDITWSEKWMKTDQREKERNAKSLHMFQNVGPFFSEVLPEVKKRLVFSSEVELHKEKYQFKVADSRGSVNLCTNMLEQVADHNSEKIKKIASQTVFPNQDLDETKIEEITNSAAIRERELNEPKIEEITNNSATKKRKTTHGPQDITAIVDDVVNLSLASDGRNCMNSREIRKTILIPESIEKDYGKEEKLLQFDDTTCKTKDKDLRRHTQFFQDVLEEDLDIRKVNLQYDIPMGHTQTTKNSRKTQYFYSDIIEDTVLITDEHHEQRESLVKIDVGRKSSEEKPFPHEDIKEDIADIRRGEVTKEETLLKTLPILGHTQTTKNSRKTQYFYSDIIKDTVLITDEHREQRESLVKIDMGRKSSEEKPFSHEDIKEDIVDIRRGEVTTEETLLKTLPIFESNETNTRKKHEGDISKKEETLQYEKLCKKNREMRKTQVFEETIEEDDEVSVKPHQRETVCNKTGENFNGRETQHFPQHAENLASFESIQVLNLRQEILRNENLSEDEKMIEENVEGPIRTPLTSKEMNNIPIKNNSYKHSSNLIFYSNDNIEEEQMPKEKTLKDNRIKDFDKNEEEGHTIFNQSLGQITSKTQFEEKLITTTTISQQTSILGKNAPTLSRLLPSEINRNEKAQATNSQYRTSENFDEKRNTVYNEEEMELDTDIGITPRQSYLHNAHLEERENEQIMSECHFDQTEIEEIADTSMKSQAIAIHSSTAKNEDSFSKVNTSTDKTTNAASLMMSDNRLNETFVTPSRNSLNQQRLRKTYEITPRLSLIEFEAREREAKFDKCSAPPKLQFLKRLHSHLTPNVPHSKRPLTLIEEDCQLEEVHPKETEPSKLPKPVEVEEKNDKAMVKINKTSFIEPDSEIFAGQIVDEISGIVPHIETQLTEIRFNRSNLSGETQLKKLQTSVLCASEKKDYHSSSLMEIIDQSTNIEDTTFTLPTVRNAERSLTEASSSTSCRKYTSRQLVFEGDPIIVPDDSIHLQNEETNRSNDSLKNSNTLTDVCPESSIDNIDEVHINLVDTLADEEENEIETARSNGDFSTQPQSQLSQPPIATNNATLLCKCCGGKPSNESNLNLHESSSDCSLLSSPSINFDRLRRLRKLPTLADVGYLWQRFSLDNTMANLAAENLSDTLSDTINKNETINYCNISELRKSYDMKKKKLREEMLKESRNTTSDGPVSVIERLRQKLGKTRHYWIFDDQMQYRGKLLFTHRLLLTSSILITYERTGILSSKLTIKTIEVTKRLPEMRLKPIDYVLGYELKLQLPLNLMTLCKSSDEIGIYEMLCTLDKKYRETFAMGQQLQRILFQRQATIARDPLGIRCFIKKTIRKIVAQPDSYDRVDCTDIQINIYNISQISFKNIFQPALFNFQEHVHLLPVGLAFLEDFLHDPLKYLKNLT
uniref:Uncharacterized protein n=1 Tax=Glossina austeni TaxID=7395 RepID=A0A1A9VPU8_GLOAU